MLLVRYFDKPSPFKEWTGKTPKIDSLLRNCFDIAPIDPNSQHVVSVYDASTSEEELECVAGLFQRRGASGNTAEVQYGLRILASDCDLVGIAHVAENEGRIGIPRVDRRHVNLAGTQEQFTELVKRILREMWKGDERLRIFVPHQLDGQIAVFSCLNDPQIEDEARVRCTATTSKSKYVTVGNNGAVVEISAALEFNKQLVQVSCSREVR